ncbi:hypothetical protein IEQ34_018133 [Dendrobium chrysotoxum]|uniref:FAD-binding PCMH-type domain-containing protein n=1 Tax=Dendrobium chrysotoxum TaxID=161865 RepID=A0AAV7FW11_DENCH|nr:hypothetical protein IEQ34_018133 [Dendrobium chrysotoxum]
MFTVSKTLEEGATKLVAHKVDKRLYIRTLFKVVGNDSEHGDQNKTNRTVQVSFNSLFVGEMKELLLIMEDCFLELQLKAEDCIEMRWIESVLYFAGKVLVKKRYQGKPLSSLLERYSPVYNTSFKHKFYFLTKPIPLEGWNRILRRFLEKGEQPMMIIDPWGGRMDEISENETTFPHRKGNLYNVHYLTQRWMEDNAAVIMKHVDWLRRFYKFMTPYVSKNPRATYLNYRDLDIGTDVMGNKTTYWEARRWGECYYKGNFKRLALVKGEVDPNNMFRKEHSIPPLFSRMKNLLILSSIKLLILPSLLFILLSSHAINVDQYNKLDENSYIQCLCNHSVPSHLYFIPQSPSYNYYFFSSVHNRRTLLNSFKPLLIFLPTVENHVQAAVLCSRSLSIPIRTRSGGHDYEGLSYTSTSGQFVLIDLQFLSSIKVDYMYSHTAWVQVGATLGQLYHAIANQSSTVAFPAGLCPTVGVGGHVSGGGFGMMTRTFGLASDNVEDIRIVVASGEIVDRQSMGEGLFWALRGGGGASFGIILAYKVRLVEVPNRVTVFTVSKTLEEGATKLVGKWQRIAHKVDKRLYIRTLFKVVGNDSEHGDQNKTNRTVQVSFNSLFVGEMKELLLIMEDYFLELQLKAEDCIEMRWIESVLYFAGKVLVKKRYQGKPLSSLLERYSPVYNTSFKHKSDFLTKLIPLEGWNIILRRFLEKGEQLMMIIDPWGGRMDEISENETAFPHRKGNLYNVHYLTRRWMKDNAAVIMKHVDWLRRFYKFMTPYVSKNPRAAYLNYRDLDIGTDVMGNKTTYWEARRWGECYYKGNFKRLAHVKGEVDPNNMFRNEQSIPPLFSRMKNLLILSSIKLLILPSLLFILLSSHAINVDQYNKLDENSYIQCLCNHSVPSHLYFTPQSPSYNYYFFSSVHNRRTLLNSFKPLLIFLPTVENHVQAAVLCSRSLSIPIRTRSGGHDYEGLSYTSTSGQFVLIDLQFLSSIKVDYMYSHTAWVQVGATLGQLYHAIANQSSTVAFPAGLCPTVGVGGHVSGGGFGMMTRTFGLASDNVEDIRIVVASGEIVDRQSMGEGLFWALRGGGGASFGIILAYKVRLVEVPNRVTVFTVSKTLEEGATKLVGKWQRIAHKVDKRLYIRTLFKVVGNDSEHGDQNKTNRIVQVSFNSLFVGEMKELLLIMEDYFLELQLKAEDCIEMRWIESVLYFAGKVLVKKRYQGKPLSSLLERYSPVYNTSFKHKSDFLTKLIPLEGWNIILRRFLEKGEQLMMIIDPWGGRMDEISENETAFPHRKGNLYNVHYLTRRWMKDNAAVIMKHVDWLRRFYKFMTPYVSKNPRAAYLNYRDLDIGTDVMGNKTTYWEARRWGECYYKGNFKRLAHVKGENSYIQCLCNHSIPSHLYFTPQSPSYNYFFFSSVRNRRALLNSFKPLLIFLPAIENHVQAAVLCSRSLSIPIRARSGGHDYEGLSYTSTSGQFVLIDLQYLSSINVQVGATLGQLYHTIANKSSTLAFPAGLCPLVGVGGHISGGGLGMMIRSFGLASDNVEDVRIVVASGEILDRKSMGEDLFWALRGRGGASFGIILAYKVRLVEVPNKVTVFTVSKTLEEGATKLVDEWQRIAHKMDKRLFIRTLFTVVGNDSELDDQNKTNRTVQVSFNSLFLGEMKKLLLIMEDCFSELQLKAEDCIEMRWIESVLYFAGYQGKPLSSLLERYSPVYNTSFKHKSDFLTKPIPLEGWNRILRRFLEKGEQPMMIIDPWGGRMDEISENETAFPHRKVNLYNVHYLTERWVEDNAAVSMKHVHWLRRFYKFMTPYVSKNPRAAYLNYRDLDIGTDVMGSKTTYWEARRWGERYYKGNFRRLAYVKGEIDPNNMFRNEQSIPPLFSS